MYRMTLPWWIPGAFLVTFGLLIAIFPELLSLLVASAFLFAGLSLLAAGWSGQRFRRHLSVTRRDEYRWFI
jgi:membrane protein implicated in regulation of membrane protease activity